MSRTATCRQCQKPNLVWRDTGKGWRLAEGFGGDIHNCTTFENNADKPIMAKPKTPEDIEYDEHISWMSQDNDQRLLNKFLGL
ncbi:hypothetical protein COPG_00021 [Colwellia phage 9A]|uniref:Uncharacterized protein n=1 Tax=Colwellia phage 9A TaxID=765765 RepID=I3UMA2_9CAUD|nr:hypothetical protein COPG_00021 [Colwellia phage 9A]AFK66617.1 hypothetical protein COPG_00021 [Colwellia phage 9A]